MTRLVGPIVSLLVVSSSVAVGVTYGMLGFFGAIGCWFVIGAGMEIWDRARLRGA